MSNRSFHSAAAPFVLLWWMPSITLGWARVLALRLRFGAEMVAVDLLFALRRDQAARNLLAAIIRRARRQLRAARRRAGRTS